MRWSKPITYHATMQAGDAEDDELLRHHRDVYFARKLLPKLVAKHVLRWPGAATVIDLHPAR